MIELVEYEDKYYNKWNEFIENSNNGTIFHRLDFLSYHGNKFGENANHLMWFKGDHVFSVLPMGIFIENDSYMAKSPFGASFGGIVHHNIKIKEAVDITATLKSYLKEKNIRRFSVTPPPFCYYLNYSNHIEYAMYSMGFIIRERLFTSVINLKNYNDPWEVFSGKSRNAARKAEKNFRILENAPAEEFYPILSEDKKRHNNATPTHSLEDLVSLKKLFPNSILFDIAVNEKGAKAGMCYFRVNRNCLLTFYMSQEDQALSGNAMNLLIFNLVKKAIMENIPYIDLGTSLDKFHVMNNILGVASFKESCGAVGYHRDTYELYVKD